jgi:glycosyltransferase involved in cell wall biosynthesis
MERIKILHLITHLGFGGGLDNTLLTVRGHSRDRFEVHLAAGQIEQDETYTDWSARAKEYADSLFIIPDLHRSVHLPHDISAVKQIAELIRRENYQIVHTHTAKAGILGRIAARRAGVPVIIHTYHAFGWQVAQSSRNTAVHKLIAATKEKVYEAVERYGASLSDALIAVADLNKREVVERKVAPPEKITTIYSGIDLERFSARSASREEICQRFGLDYTLPIVGMIGRLSTQKAPLDFVKAAKLVLQSLPNVQFVMVGDGPMAEEVEAAIGTDHRIKILGFMEDVTEIFTILDVFALASLWEGLGRALTEAMIMGVPVAATAVGGVPELVIHKETGLLSAPQEPAKLAENILWLLNHQDEARKMSERARNRVVPAFSGDYMVEQIEVLYDRVMLEKNSG